MNRPLYGAAAAAVLWGCLFSSPKEERCAAGTIETTNGCSVVATLTAALVLPNGSPAAKTPVYLLDEKEWLAKVRNNAGIALDSTITDSAGKFKFANFDTTRPVSLLVNAGGVGALIRTVNQDILDTLYAGKIGLMPLVNYEGVVQTPPPGQLRVLLAGTPYSSAVDSAGKFVIQNVPPEKYSVIIMVTSPDLSVGVAVAKDAVIKEGNLPDTLLPDTTKTLVLEDFEDLDNRSKLGPLFGGGWWDVLSDEYLGGNAHLLQPVNAAPANFTSAIRDGGTQGPHSLRVLYQAGTRAGAEKPYSYVFAGLNIGSSLYNLSKVRQLTFFARGTGDVVVELLQQPTGTGVHVTASRRVTLDTAWQQFAVIPDSLAVEVVQFPLDPMSRQADFLAAKLPPYTRPPTTWSEMGGMVQAIRFLGTGGNEFWLDDIRVHGVDLGDLVK